MFYTIYSSAEPGLTFLFGLCHCACLSLSSGHGCDDDDDDGVFGELIKDKDMRLAFSPKEG